MKSANIEIDSLDILQELFGINDKLIKVIENRLGVSITQRNSCITVSGTNDGRIRSAVNIIEAMQEALGKQQQLSVDMIHRFLDETEEEDDREEDLAGSTRKVLGDAVTLNYKNIPIRTKTIGQKNYINALKNNTVTICIGPAGTGKTYLAMALAVAALKRHEVGRLILTRPVVEAGENLGFLPGTLEEKIDPYMRPLYDALFDMMDRERTDELMERGVIEIAPLAYMRGRTLSDAFVVLDEAQNTTPEQMKMFLTRLGFNSKFVITGDLSQRDLVGRRGGLADVERILGRVDDVAFSHLERADVVRHALVGRIVEAYDAYDDAREQRARDRKESR